jgi:hypothetical protein
MAVRLRPILPFVLQEQGGLGRVVTLTGADLPEEYPTLGGRVRGTTRWYPGSERATTQILGPEEGGITFSGCFHDRRRGIPGNALSKMNAIDQMRRSARLVRVTYGPLSRVCRWLEASFQIEELERIHYRIDLEIVDHEFGELRRVFQDVRRIPGVGAILDAASRTKEILDVLPPGVGSDALDRAKTALDRGLGAVGIAGGLLTAIGAVGQVVNPAQAFQALSFVDSGSQDFRGAALAIQTLDWRGAAGDDFTRATSAAHDTARASTAVTEVSREIHRVRPDIVRLAGTDGAQDRVYVAAQGETLQRIALRFYGDAGAWPRIARRNAITNPTLAAGQVVTIPDAPSQSKQVEVAR